MKRFRPANAVLVLLILVGGFSLTYGQSSTTQPFPKASEVTQKVSVNRKPEPKYTKEARKLGITGTVVLRCIFRSSGKVTDITAIQGLSNGLTERAIEAAKNIKFQPAMKDGHPVSMWMQLEYNFNLY